ncbi:hypothetical protein ACQE98_17535 [Ornithinimicrobium sp. W1679]|uniref:hypothetical protein n=1 Tax=Ornithinimicrobium sp. W1679 TaxID=3418770 RepID=UPI003CF2359C
MKAGISVSVMLTALAVGGCSGTEIDTPAAEEATTTSAPPPRALVDAARACGLADAGVLGDAGASLTIRTGGDETTSEETYEDVGCLLVQLDTPDHVISHMDSTRALDGMQDDEWGDITARWTYHPDDGMNLTLVDRASTG